MSQSATSKPRARFLLLGVVLALGTVVAFQGFLLAAVSSGGLADLGAEVVDSATSGEPLPDLVPEIARLNLPNPSALDAAVPRRLFLFTLTQRGPVTIDVNGDFDSYLELSSTGSGGSIAQDDDSGDGLNPRIQTTLEPGSYSVLVRPYSSGTTGSFTLFIVAPNEPAQPSGT